MYRIILSLLFIAFPVQLVSQNCDLIDDVGWIERKLNIGPINLSTNDIDLRVFLGTGITNGGHVLHIYRNNNHWSGYKYDYFLNVQEINSNRKIKKVTKTVLASKDWDLLWIQLEELNILSLPDQSEIKDRLRREVDTPRGKAYQEMLVMDGSGYSVIVKKQSDINCYSFHEPWLYSSKFPEVDEVRQYSEIITTLENELSVRFRH